MKNFKYANHEMPLSVTNIYRIQNNTNKNYTEMVLIKVNNNAHEYINTISKECSSFYISLLSIKTLKISRMICFSFDELWWGNYCSIWHLWFIHSFLLFTVSPVLSLTLLIFFWSSLITNCLSVANTFIVYIGISFLLFSHTIFKYNFLCDSCHKFFYW